MESRASELGGLDGDSAAAAALKEQTAEPGTARVKLGQILYTIYAVGRQQNQAQQLNRTGLEHSL